MRSAAAAALYAADGGRRGAQLGRRASLDFSRSSAWHGAWVGESACPARN